MRGYVTTGKIVCHKNKVMQAGYGSGSSDNQVVWCYGEFL